MKGAIIGDIVGSVYEFNNIKTKDFPLFREDSFFTDDTVMTVAVADAMLTTRSGLTRDAIVGARMQEQMLRYGRRFPHRGVRRRFPQLAVRPLPQALLQPGQRQRHASLRGCICRQIPEGL